MYICKYIFTYTKSCNHENNVLLQLYHHNNFVATHSLGCIMYGYTLLYKRNKEKRAQQAIQGTYYKCS